MEKSLKRVRRLAVIAVFAVIAVAAIGFAAANTVPESGAGDGSGAISGYTVTNIDYTLEAADPQNIDYVEFDVNPTLGAGDAETVQVQFVAAGAWTSCTNMGGTLWRCNPAAGTVSVLAAGNLRVVAVE